MLYFKRFPSYLKVGLRWEFELDTKKSQREDLFLLIKHSRAGSAERLINLLDGWRHLGAIKENITEKISLH